MSGCTSDGKEVQSIFGCLESYHGRLDTLKNPGCLCPGTLQQVKIWSPDNYVPSLYCRYIAECDVNVKQQQTN